MEHQHIAGPDDQQITQFIADGYLRIDNAFSKDAAARARDLLWQQLDVNPNQPESWTQPVVRLGMQIDPDIVATANTPQLYAAYDALVGKGRWVSPQAIGTFPIRFPSDIDPQDSGWHVDMSFGTENPDFMAWRINVKTDHRALLMLFLYSDVSLDDAPTRIRAGSHAHIARQLLPHGQKGLSLHDLATDGFASSDECPEVLATGDAGTVYLCHPFIVHAAQPHHGREPRFMAQPSLIPTGGFDPALPPSPVQRAIRLACGLNFG